MHRERGDHNHGNSNLWEKIIAWKQALRKEEKRKKKRKIRNNKRKQRDRMVDMHQ